MKKKIIITGAGLIILILILAFFIKGQFAEKREPLWKFRAVDTVKYSRDLTGQMLDKPEFDLVIEQQTADVASLGATHISIGAPYDQNYIPFLARWVRAARDHGLKVWFRGNFSGWEKWFGYQRIGRAEHKKLLESFITNNSYLFEDGDIFTSCPECENGGPGDPRSNGDVRGFRQFLIDEYKISSESFGKINRKVNVGYYSMNYDVAKLVMDKDTTLALGNIVAIDHYVKDPAQISKDAKEIAQQSGGKVVLGEFGAPIPDIHGDMSEEEQAKWIEQALEEAGKTPEIIGVNYWVNIGGSTRLWDDKGVKRKAADTIKKFFTATKVTQ